MHRALLLPEVVNGIADSFDILTSPLWLVAERRTSLRAMMTLNHVFSEVALDKLWAVCDPCDLARLMPSGCWYEEVQDKEDPDVIRRSTDQAWEVGKYEKRERTIKLQASLHDTITTLFPSRFAIYSRRVVHLAWPQLGKRRGTVGQDVLTLWHVKQREMLPRLRELTIFFWSGGAEEIPIIPMLSFLSPMIRRLDITINESAIEIMREIKQQTMETVFSHSGLNELRYKVEISSYAPGHPTDGLVIGLLPIQAIIRGIPPLRDVHIQAYVAAYTLHQLVLCADLHTLRIRHKRLPYGDTALSPIPIVSPLPSGSFPQLKHLEVEEEHDAEGKYTCDIACALVAPGSLDRLQNIMITSQSMSAEEWNLVFRGIGTHTFINQIHVEIVECLTISTALTLFEPLMALHRLEHLNISFYTVRVDEIDAHDLLRFLSSFPLLRELNIVSHVGAMGLFTCAVPFVAFTDILFMCPHLTESNVAVNCSFMPAEDVIAAVELLSHPFAEALTLTRTDSVDLHMLAVTLRRMLPRVTEVYDPDDEMDERLEGLLAM